MSSCQYQATALIGRMSLETYTQMECQYVKFETLTTRLNWMSMYFPNRLELSLLRVLAFPNASNTEFATRSLSLIIWIAWSPCVTFDMKYKTFLDASVFPDPDSPNVSKLHNNITSINSSDFVVFYI